MWVEYFKPEIWNIILMFRESFLTNSLMWTKWFLECLIFSCLFGNWGMSL